MHYVYRIWQYQEILIKSSPSYDENIVLGMEAGVDWVCESTFTFA